MNKNKRIIIISISLLLVVFLVVMTACKKGSANGEVVVVTDANGVPVTDENGEAITVVLETEIVEVTNANGEKVYDENGEVKTSVIYHSQEVDIPVTDENGEVVRDSNGNVVTTRIVVPPTTGGPVVTQVVQTDANGNPITKPNGETITYTLVYTTNPATPGDNNANWGTTFGGSENDLYVSNAATPDGGYIALVQSGSTDGSAQGLTDGASAPYMVLIKYGSNGKLQWQKAISAGAPVLLTDIDVDASGNIFVAGYTMATDMGFSNYGDYDAVILKYNSSGDMQWVKNFGGTLTDAFNSISVSPDGSVVAAGFTYSPDGSAAPLGVVAGKSTPAVVKYDTNGNTLFVKGYGSTGDAYSSVDVDQSGNIYLVGNFASKDDGSLIASFGKADAVVMKLDSNGNKIWHQQYGGSRIENFSGIVATSDGCAIVGRSQSADNSLAALGNQGGYDAIIAKFDSNGGLSWNTAFRGYYDDTFTDVKTMADGSYVVCGYSNSGNRDFKTIGNKGGTDAVIVTFSTSGQVTSAQGYGGSNNDMFNGICVISSGEYVACGSSLSSDGDLVGSKAVSDGTHTVGMIARFK